MAHNTFTLCCFYRLWRWKRIYGNKNDININKKIKRNNKTRNRFLILLEIFSRRYRINSNGTLGKFLNPHAYTALKFLAKFIDIRIFSNTLLYSYNIKRNFFQFYSFFIFSNKLFVEKNLTNIVEKSTTTFLTYTMKL